MADNHSSQFVRILREIAHELSLDIRDFSSDWAFRLYDGKKQAFIVGYQFPLNTSTARELCQDKALASEVLTAAGVPNVLHVFLPAPEIAAYMEVPEPDDVFTELRKDRPYVVVKDNYGTGGHRVLRVETLSEFREALRGILARSNAACASPFYEIREEYRVVMLKGRPMLVIRKERPTVTGDGAHTVRELIPEELRESGFVKKLPEETLSMVPGEGETVKLNWKHNLGQGAQGVIVRDKAVLRKLHALAKRAAAAVNAAFLSVDIIDTDEGLLVLELNGGVMMEHFAGQDEECRRIAKRIYKKAVRMIFEEEPEVSK